MSSLRDHDQAESGCWARHRLRACNVRSNICSMASRRLLDPTVGNCARCGARFEGQRNKRYCSLNCAKRAHESRARETRRGSGPQRRGRSSGICLECSTPFVGQANKRFCSRPCARRYYRRAHPIEHRESRRRYVRRHPERIREQDKRRRAERRTRDSAHRLTPEYRTRQREYSRRYRERNPERAKAIHRKYRLRHPEKHRAATRRWRELNPARHAHVQAARRARELQASGTHTYAEWKALLAVHGHRCAYCGSTGKLTKDHCLPLKRGGSHAIENIVPACRPCNQRKGTLTADEYRERMKVDAALA
jgi:5-methylcytosine-specific restriction endonuclease McrA